jgi:hypothetical protein
VSKDLSVYASWSYSLATDIRLQVAAMSPAEREKYEAKRAKKEAKDAEVNSWGL